MQDQELTDQSMNNTVAATGQTSQEEVMGKALVEEADGPLVVQIAAVAIITGHQNPATVEVAATSSAAVAPNMTLTAGLTRMNQKRRRMRTSRTTSMTWTTWTQGRRETVPSSISELETLNPSSRQQQICSEAAQARPSPSPLPLTSATLEPQHRLKLTALAPRQADSASTSMQGARSPTHLPASAT